MAVEAEKSAEFGFGIVGNLLRNIGAAIVANQSVGRIVFNLRGLRFGLHDFIGVLVGFWVVVGGNGKTVEIAVFDSHSLRLGNGFVGRVLPGAEPFESKRFARFGVDKSDGNFNSNELFDITFGSRDFLRAQKVGGDDGSEPVFCKRGIDFFKHVGSSGVFVAVKVVGAIFGDVGTIFHDLDELFGNLLHKQSSN